MTAAMTALRRPGLPMNSCVLRIALVVVLMLLAACGKAPASARDTRLSVAPWPLPAQASASMPDFSPTPEGNLLLSWVQAGGGAQRLMSAQFHSGHWKQAVEVASGAYFGSSVDAPHVRITPDRAMWAQWLRKSPAGGHARDVVLSRSGDDGATWSAPVLVNLDATPTEHGFVAMWPAGKSGLGVAWLDGRATQSTQQSSSSHADNAVGATMVRTAMFDSALDRQHETEVDSSSCDCCQMDAAETARGPLLVYRDRAPGDVRDIVVSTLESGHWTLPNPVYADHWVMTACPVNGPAIAASGDAVAVAWYTGAGSAPSVRLAVSTDAGRTFAAPVQISQGAAVMGNVDVALDDHAVWMLWLAELPNGQALWIVRMDRGTGRLEQMEVARLTTRGRGAGVPKLLLSRGRAYAVWTDATDSIPALHGATISASDPG